VSARPFASILDTLTRQRWVTAALVVSERDGIVVESNLQIGQSGDRVAALAASLYRKARLSARAAGLGAVSFMQLEAPNGRLCAVGGGDLVLVVVAEPAVNVGLVRVELLRAVRDLLAVGGADEVP
jgi:predicted regulator of Ras-like GTPase activity (Roadblock/LC7/MglB family)